VVREYVYSGDHLVLEVDGHGRDLAEYVYYPGVDAPHSVRRRDAAGNWRTYYYLTEAPGHVVGLIDETGQVVREYAYTPFGEMTETTPAGVAPVENPLTYTAREWDAEVGLYSYRARYYDPVLQRFISEDPIGLAGRLNPYSFSAFPIRSSGIPQAIEGLPLICWTSLRRGGTDDPGPTGGPRCGTARTGRRSAA
jgi:RHS repeat-associated protein